MEPTTEIDLEIAYQKLKSHFYHDTSDLFQRRQIAAFETSLSGESNLYDALSYLKPYKQKSDTFSAIITRIEINKKFEIIAKEINRYHEAPGFFDVYFKRIKLKYLPKKIKPVELGSADDNFLTNVRVAKDYTLSRINIFIDIPTELHLIVVIWILRYGYLLDKQLSKNCYGNRLLLNKNENKIIEGSGLFLPYFKQYQKWRDKGIQEAKRKLEENEDIAFINLDLQDYFYSVRIDFEEIEKEIHLTRSGDNIHRIFKRIHQEFTEKLIKANYPNDGINESNGKFVLPIGLLSSPIIANWYLKSFDRKLIEEVRPAYYGRYVDDMLILLTNPVINDIGDTLKSDNNLSDKNKKTFVEKFLEKYLEPVAELIEKPEYMKEFSDDSKCKTDSGKIFELKQRRGCFFQGEKTLIYHFDSNESTSAIDKLKFDIERRASEFSDVPEDNWGDGHFDEQAFHLIFDNTEGKFRTLKDYKENRYGLSTFLSNRIFTALRRSKISDVNDGEKVLKLFKGANVLDNFRLWEKVFIFFMSQDNKAGFVQFYKNTHLEIEKINSSHVGKSKIKGDKVKNSLIEYLNVSLEMALSLFPTFLKPGDNEYTNFEYFVTEKNAEYEKELLNYHPIRRSLLLDDYYITRFRKSNLIRHHFVPQPLLNFSKLASAKDINLTSRHLDLPPNISANALSLDEKFIKNNPRNVRFWECCISTVREQLYSITPNELTLDKNYGRYDFLFFSSPETTESPDDEHPGQNLLVEASRDYLYIAFNQFLDINKKIKPSSFLDRREEIRKALYKIFKPKAKITDFDKEILVQEIHVNTKNKLDGHVSLAIVNTELAEQNLIKSMRGAPQVTHERFKDLAKVLNQASSEGVDLLILPECSVPHDLLPSLAQWSERNQIMLVTGLEHWNINGIIYNFIVTILPTEIEGIKDAVVIYRLKNFYSHEEELMINGEGYIVPKPEPLRYDMFNWRGLYFAPYYCFEVANSIHRSLFRSKIDLLIVSEWNKDTNYYSNIVESLSRDLHVYVAQVNTSEYGDSRLTRPASTALKDIIKLKGGKNSTILVGSFDVKALREFQRKSFSLTKGDSQFKPLPPDFDRNFVLKRVQNKSIF